MTPTEVHQAQVREALGDALTQSYGQVMPARLLDVVTEFACEQAERFIAASALLRRAS